MTKKDFLSTRIENVSPLILPALPIPVAWGFEIGMAMRARSLTPAHALAFAREWDGKTF